MKVLKEKLLLLLPYITFFVVGIFLLFEPILDGDEIWNYNFARNICEGRLPYVDFNMIQTPLSAYLAASVLKVFGNTLFNFRIVAIILLALVFGSLYRLCEKIIGDNTIAFVITVFVYGLNFIFWNYNYNNLNLLLLIWILYLEWKKYENESCVLYDVLIGLLVGIIPLIKQSTGAVLLVVNIILCFGDIVCKRSKWKQKFVRIGISLIPTLIFAGILVIQNSFQEFWDFAIAGIGEFTHKITYFEFLISTPVTFLIGIFPVIAIGVCIYSMIKNKEKRRLTGTCLLWAFGGAVVAYPLCDSTHMVVAIVPFVPCIFLNCKIKKLKFYEIYLCQAVAWIVLLVSALSVFEAEGEYKKCELNYFRGIRIEKAMEEHIREVTDYMVKQDENGQRVAVADEYGALYTIPLNQCNKNLDMLLLGNMGTYDVSEILDEYEDYILLVRKENATLGYQANVDLILNVKESYKKIDEVSSFDAYIREKEN